MKKIHIAILLLCSIIISPESYAFKINTHAYIGQQIINDIESDGKIDIEIGGKIVSIDVPLDVKNAILKERDYFLMGTIGPDATPDVVVGQSVIHPGADNIPGRWEVSDWLDYLSNNMQDNDKGKAFYYGYLSHVSSDVFAHTYVNQYTGDIFNLGDGETLVEQRHIALEGYIDSHTPQFKNNSGHVISDTASNLITLDKEYGLMIRDKLVFDDDVYNQYKKNEYASHLVGYKAARDEINDIANNKIWHEIDKIVLKFISNYYYGYDMSDEEADKLLKGFQPINEVLNGKIPDYLQSFENKTHENLKKWEELGFNTLVNKVREAQSLEKKIRDKRYELDKAVIEFDRNLRQDGCDFAANLMDTIDPTGITSTLSDSDFVISSLKDPIQAANQLFNEAKNSWPVKQTCKIENVRCGGWRGKLDPTCWVSKNVCTNPKPYVNYSATFNKDQFVRQQFNTYRTLKDVNESDVNKSWLNTLELASSLFSRDLFIPIAGDILIPVVFRSESVINVTMTLNNIAIYRSNNYSDFNNGIKTLIYQYNTETSRVTSNNIAFCRDINLAIDDINNHSVKLIHSIENEIARYNNQLIEKNIEIRNETVKVADELHNIKNLIVDLNQMLIQRVSPIQSLLLGWRDELDDAMLHYTIAASQSMVNTTNKNIDIPYQPVIDWFNDYHMALIAGTKINGIANSASQIIESIDKIKKLSNLNPLDDVINKEIDKLKDKATNLVKDKLTEEITKFLPDEMKQLLDILAKDSFSDEELNYYFTTPEVSETYKGLIMIPDIAERVKAEMHLVNGKYDPNQYSVVKNSVTLSKLALLNNIGLMELAKTIDVTPSTVGNLENLVKGAFKNIDANHQWMEVSPPLPRDSGFSPMNNGKSYANENMSFSSSDGFFLWGKGENVEEFRNKAFRMIFKGPLNMGIDAPEMIEMKSIVTEQYKELYNPEENSPFPSLK
ncbi:zinc dependent phospholipase C family protein [Photobacterium chitinilyticum]|uniref:zinc dependent phospholipase C family protein n=1 Tax=Photobacterium chitinilyticum TaxID=2485123 RepID=UPI003D13B265